MVRRRPVPRRLASRLGSRAGRSVTPPSVPLTVLSVGRLVLAPVSQAQLCIRKCVRRTSPSRLIIVPNRVIPLFRSRDPLILVIPVMVPLVAVLSPLCVLLWAVVVRATVPNVRPHLSMVVSRRLTTVMLVGRLTSPCVARRLVLRCLSTLPIVFGFRLL